MRQITRGDWEAFFALGLDVLLVFILMQGFCLGFLGFSQELFFKQMLPGVAIGLIVGNGFYAYQAIQLARREGRTDVCAIPYGTSIITVVIYVFLIMFPVQQIALSRGLPKEEADILAWHVGLWACIASGLVEFFGAFVAHHIRRFTPRIVLLVAVAGVGIAFLSMDLIFRTFAYPVVGFTALALILVFYFGGIKPKGGIPSGVVVILIGSSLAWALYALGLPSVVPNSVLDTGNIGVNLPQMEIINAINSIDLVWEYLPIVIPFGFVFLISGLQNIESAAAAGDNYRPRPLLLMNGVGSLATAAFGSPFPTSVYVGHPGYKRMGGRAGYSTINAVFWTLVCFTGALSVITYAVPVEAVMPLIVWVGIVVCAQAFQVSESRHMPAVIVGLLPALAAYVAMAVKHALAVSGMETDVNLFTDETFALFGPTRNFFAEGMFALGQGYIYSCMVLAAIVYYVIEREFVFAAYWSLAGAGLSMIGFMHEYVIKGGDVVSSLSFPVVSINEWAIGYLLMACVFLIVPRISRPIEFDKSK